MFTMKFKIIISLFCVISIVCCGDDLTLDDAHEKGVNCKKSINESDKEELLDALRANNDIILVERSSSKLLNIKEFCGDFNYIESIEKHIKRMEFDVFFDDGADAVLIVLERQNSGVQANLLYRVDCIPVFDQKVELELNGELYLFPVDELQMKRWD